MSEVTFEGQVALVTGASRGIGAAIAAELARKGLKVIGTATTDAGAAKIREALSAYPGCDGRTLDVTDGAAGEALVDSIAKELGGLQVLAFAIALLGVLLATLPGRQAPAAIEPHV